MAADLPPRQRNLADEPIREVELWDLVSAFGRIIRENVAVRPSSIVYDDTPIHVHMSRILARLQEHGRLALSELLDARPAQVGAGGMFLAMLELVRHHRVQAEQNELFGEIWLLPGTETAALDLSQVDNYEHSRRLRGQTSRIMINNLPVKSLTHKDITIEGYSRAAVQTYWRIPEFKLGFDLGAQPWSFMGTPTWFVSHTHMDHIVNLPVYIARRRMMKMEPPVIYLPEAAIDTVQKILRLFSKMDRGRLPCELLPARPGDEIELSARAGGDRFGHGAYRALAGLRRLATAAEA